MLLTIEMSPTHKHAVLLSCCANRPALLIGPLGVCGCVCVCVCVCVCGFVGTAILRETKKERDPYSKNVNLDLRL